MISLTRPGGGVLTPAEHKAFEDTLRTSHDIRITVSILDQNEQVLGQLHPRVLTGAVQVDATQSVTRSLSMTLLDPNNTLDFDGNSPSAGAVFADNFASVQYGVYVASHDLWVDVPVFVGPLTGFERTGPEVTVEAQGKETLGLDPCLVIHGYTLQRGLSVQKAIKNVMGRLGETHYNLGMLRGNLHRHRPVAPGVAPWAVITGGGDDGNGHPIPGLISKAKGHMYIFYDGRGKVTAKQKVSKAKWTFGAGDMIGLPTVRYDVMEARNHVEVMGGTPKHSKHHFRGNASLPPGHPLSPHALARHGKPRYMTTFYQSDNLKSNHACRVKAKQLLAGSEAVTASFDSLVIPHLEEYDAVAVQIKGTSFSWPVGQFTIPLTADSSMAVGYNKSVKPRAAASGHHHHHGHKGHHKHKHHHRKGH